MEALDSLRILAGMLSGPTELLSFNLLIPRSTSVYHKGSK